MQKTVIEQFISKYFLGGAADAVLWKSDGKTVEVSCISDDKNVLAKVRTDNITLPAGEYGVFNTSQLNSLLNVLEEKIELTLKTSKGRSVAFGMSDSSTKVEFVLSEASVIPPAPGLKTLPPWDIKIPIDKKFVDTFIRAKSALQDVETFTVLSEKSVPKIIIGYSDMNTNRVTIEINDKQHDYPQLQPINFSARFMREILVANREAKAGYLNVSEKGLAHVTFELGNEFNVDYYLVQIQTATV